jgi:hypothetical protein
VPQHVQILDAVRAGGHPGHDRADLAGRVHPWSRGWLLAAAALTGPGGFDAPRPAPIMCGPSLHGAGANW